jgi:hypothetical protein
MIIKISILFLSCFLIHGCAKEVQSSPAGFSFQTERLANEMLRMENDEVICYRWDKGGLSCTWK